MVEKFLLVGTKANLPQTRDANKLYWCSDTRELFKGNDLYTEAVRIVDAVPATPAQGVLYVLPTGEVKVFDGAATHDVVKAYATSAYGEGVVDENSTDDEIATAKLVYQSIVDALAEVSSGGGVVNNIISTKAGIITVTKGMYVRVADDATYSATTNYYVMSGSSYAVTTVTEDGFDAAKALGLYVSSDETDVAVKGAVCNPSYDSTSRTITLPIAGEQSPLVISLGKDIFTDPAAPNEYNIITKNIELYLNNGEWTKVADEDTFVDSARYYTAVDNGAAGISYLNADVTAENFENLKTAGLYTTTATMIAFSAAELIDIYTGEVSVDGTTSTTVSNDNKITVSVNVSATEGNALTKNADGLFVDISGKADASTVTELTETVNGLSSTVTANTEAITANADAITALADTLNDAVYVAVTATDTYDATKTYYEISDGAYVVATVEESTFGDKVTAGLYVLVADSLDELKAKVAQNATDIATNKASIKAATYVQCTANSVFSDSATYYILSGGEYVSTSVTADTFDGLVASGLYTNVTSAAVASEARVADVESSLEWGTFA